MTQKSNMKLNGFVELGSNRLKKDPLVGSTEGML